MNKTIIELFKEQVLKTPDAIAVIFETEEISYRALDHFSNQISVALAKKGIAEEILVPICIERSIELVAGILGILKAGGAYVPIDPTYPNERIHFILNDISASILIVSKTTLARFDAIEDLDVVEISELRTNSFDEEALRVNIKPAGLANVIYTSGSTGKPRGVLVEHRNITSLVKEVGYVFLSAKDVLLSTGSPSFDATTFEYWSMLLNGGQLVICPEEVLLSTDLLKEEIIKRKVTKMWFTSSYLNQLVETDITLLKGLETIIAGGEKLSEKHIDKIRKTYPGIVVLNGYGPTENTTFSLTHQITDISPGSSIPIGKPLTNRYVYILNEHLEKVDDGVAAEICLGGAGLARGYLNNQELTSEKFIVDPFENSAGQRLYKTGDIGRFLPDGSVEYLGRKDDQVKIRGYRVELGEVDFAMQALDFVDDTCTVVIKDASSQTNRLVNYYIPNRTAVKSKEKELYQKLVASWRELYEDEYGKTENLAENTDPEFNLIGWNDSFTGEPFPKEHMREWLDDITKEILDQKPDNVLEIGSGTGLIYYKLAGKVKKYIGTDFSKTAITEIEKQISKGLRDYGNTELRVGAAHEVALKDDETVDTIILNSIIQYFPGEEYLADVIEQCVKLLKGRGRIIIGDVRDLRLLESFKGLLKLNKVPNTMATDKFKWEVEQEALREEELCVSPDYFLGLKTIYPEITHVDINWKSSSYTNELSCYRYTVVLHVGISKEIIKPGWTNWNEADKQVLLTQLLQNKSTVAIKNVPNPRLYRERVLNKGLKNNLLRTTAQLHEEILLAEDEYSFVKQLSETANQNNYEVKFLINEDPFKINLLFRLNPSQEFIVNTYVLKNTGSVTNTPLFAEINAQLKKDIRKILQQKLPEFMIPAEFTALHKFPLNVNGKIERRLLAGIKEKQKTSKINSRLPQNRFEEIVTKIWEQYLDVEGISVYDNFFQLGGHSLSAIRIVSAISKELEIKITIKDLFIYPTIAALAGHLQNVLEKTTVDANYKSLISIKTRGHKIPLYIVCGGGGTVFAFKRFAEMLDDEQPVYGLQQPMESKDLEKFPDTIEDIAARYLSDIFSHDPYGPYALAGHCVGGIIAFEMAKQLNNLGKHVALIAMFDTDVPFQIKEHESFNGKFLHRIALLFKTGMTKLYSKLHFETFLLTKHPAQALYYKLNSLKNLANKLHSKNDNQMQVFEKLEENFIKANQNYEIKHLELDILVFYAKERYHFMDREKNVTYRRIKIDEKSKNLWKHFAKSVKMYEIEGEHSTIFEPGHASEFAEILQEHLNKCN